MNRVFKIVTMATLGGIVLHKASATQVAQPDSPIVIITQEGIVPVRYLGGKPPKNSGTTYYLSSALPPQKKKAAPTPTPLPPKYELPIRQTVVKEKVQPTPKKEPPKQLVQAKPSSTPPELKKRDALAQNTLTKPAPLKSAPAPVPPAVKTADSRKDLPNSAPPKETPKITVKKQASPATEKVIQGKKPGVPVDDDFDEYSTTALISDPLEPMNRGTFWVNHQLYRYIFKPVSRTYDTVLPNPVRTGVYNIFDNLEFPVRFVNDVLQFKFRRAWQETGRFVVNSTAGIGGIMRVSDRIPALSDVPAAETGQTLAKWGIGHGAYLVLPVFGPKSLRDTVGLAGDIALSPVTWLTFGAIGGVGGATTLAFSTPDSARTLHGKLGAYDAATENTLDRYLAVRTAYSQSRKQATQR